MLTAEKIEQLKQTGNALPTGEWLELCALAIKGLTASEVPEVDMSLNSWTGAKVVGAYPDGSYLIDSRGGQRMRVWFEPQEKKLAKAREKLLAADAMAVAIHKEFGCSLVNADYADIIIATNEYMKLQASAVVLDNHDPKVAEC